MMYRYLSFNRDSSASQITKQSPRFFAKLSMTQPMYVLGSWFFFLLHNARTPVMHYAPRPLSAFVLVSPRRLTCSTFLLL
jgi:hypothetical protein